MEYSHEMQCAFDIDWFAIDDNGNIAHFASCCSAIPPSVAASKEDNELLFQYFKSLPDIAENIAVRKDIEKLLGTNAAGAMKSYLADFMGWARKGLLAYDTKHVGVFSNTEYDLITQPDVLVNATHIPPQALIILKRTKLKGAFADVPELDIERFVEVS